MPASRASEWEPEAERWIEWTRTPGFDAYWTYRDAFFEDVLSPAGERTLEVGCGEGRVARDHGWTHSLEDYSLALERAGFHIECIREPRPDLVTSAYSRWRAAPLFMNFRAVSRGSA